MAASKLKMAAACAVLVIVLSTAGQPAMAADFLGLVVPTCSTSRYVCEQNCRDVCKDFAEKVLCEKLICGVQGTALQVLGKTCVDVFTPGCEKSCVQLCLAIPT